MVASDQRFVRCVSRTARPRLLIACPAAQEGGSSMGDRTFPDTYRDTRVKRPDFPLADAISWFLADKASEVEPTTLRTYRSHLNLFCNWLPESRRTMSSLEPETAERWL